MFEHIFEDLDQVRGGSDEEILVAFRKATKVLSEHGIDWVLLRKVLTEMPPCIPDKHVAPVFRYHATEDANKVFQAVADKELKPSQRKFLEGVRAAWLNNGCLTSAQAQKLCEIAEELAVPTEDFNRYVGYATQEWLEASVASEACGQQQ